MNTLDGKLNDALKQQKISDKLFFDNSLIKQVTRESVYALIDNMDRFVDLFDGYNTNENDVDENTAGINIRNDLMHGSLPINDYTIGYAKLVYLLVLSLCI
jgi:hypothetical protein